MPGAHTIKSLKYEGFYLFYFLEKISFTAPIIVLGSNVIAKNAVNRLNWGVLYGVNHSTKSSELEILPNNDPSLNFLNSGHE